MNGVRSLLGVEAMLRARGLLHHVEAAAREHHVTVADICGRCRTKTVAAARQSAWLRIRALGLSTPEIGALFERDHTTILHGVAKAKGVAAARLAGKRVA